MPPDLLCCTNNCEWFYNSSFQTSRIEGNGRAEEGIYVAALLFKHDFDGCEFSEVHKEESSYLSVTGREAVYKIETSSGHWISGSLYEAGHFRSC